MGKPAEIVMNYIQIMMAGASLASAALLASVLHKSHDPRDMAATLTVSAPAAALAHGSVPPMGIGMNVGPLNYWTSDWPFADIVQNTGTPLFGWTPVTNQIPLDDGGHPINVPVGTTLHVMLSSNAPRVMSGAFDCHVSRGWKIRPFGSWTMQGDSTSFQMVVPKPAPKQNVAIELTAVTNNATLRELSCRRADLAPENVFNPAFLDDLRPFHVIRFLNWMHTNNAPTLNWAGRTTPASFSQAGDKGVALEFMVALANRLHADPWFTLPMDTDPTYYRNFAMYVRDHLSPDQRVYIELSNEVWNVSFGQGKMAVSRGKERYPNASPQEASDWYYGDRVRAVMAIWSDVFKGQDKRIVRVLSSQQANPRRAEQALSHNDTWRSVDALATAAYFGASGREFPVSGVARVDAIFVSGPKLLDQVMATAHGNKDIATKYHVRYIAYEGGPGFEAYQADIKADLLAVERDPRMYDLYTQFLKRWQREIGDTFVAFDSVSDGFWAHKTYTGEAFKDAPKARALADFAPGK